MAPRFWNSATLPYEKRARSFSSRWVMLGTGGDLAAEAVREALPELSGVVVEQHGARVVVGGRIEGGAQLRCVWSVVDAAAAGGTVRAVVDRAEGGGREGGEDAGMVADGGADVSAVVPSQASADEVVGVARVGPCAGRAAGGAAVAAGDAETPARLGLG
ncbi:hypothetical protein GCM10020000_39170 [Streptomyces olivoverticillatus]